MLDDGFQHRAIARAFDLVLVDGRRGPLLPAGPLREPLAALRRADAVVLVERDDGDAAVAAARRARGRPSACASRRSRWSSRSSAAGASGRIGQLADRRVVAVTGVARPEAFYAMLRRWEAVIAEVFEYPDHHRYTPEDWQRIARGGHAADLIVTTEKDLVKLEAFPFATGKLVALRIAPQVERADELIAAILATTGLQAHPGKENRNGHQ